MKRKPYQKIKVGNDFYYDYNFKINGIIYEISINDRSKLLFITKDEDQNIN